MDAKDEQDAEDLPLLNVYEVQVEGETRHLVCFLDPVLAGIKGITEGVVVGEFAPDAEGQFDPETFAANPAFIQVLTDYMNHAAVKIPDLIELAKSQPNKRLYLVDPRHPDSGDEEPPPEDVVGHFVVDGGGEIVSHSFRYNEEHLWFNPETGVSGILSDRSFYDWLHPMPESEPKMSS